MESISAIHPELMDIRAAEPAAHSVDWIGDTDARLTAIFDQAYQARP